MYFETKSDWEYDDPFLSSLDDPSRPTFRWCAVEMQLAIYYYHVHILPNSNKKVEIGTNILCGGITFALEILYANPKSKLSLQTPAWLNNGVPSLNSVIAVYKALEHPSQAYIAECADGKMCVLNMDAESQSMNPEDVDKETLWTSMS